MICCMVCGPPKHTYHLFKSTDLVVQYVIQDIQIKHTLFNAVLQTQGVGNDQTITQRSE